MRDEDRQAVAALLRRGHHDIGGLAAGPVEKSEHDYAEWERRVDALMVLLSGVRGGRRLMTVDELRRNIEALPPEAYDRMGYYERWVTAIAQTLIQRGVIRADELARRMAEKEGWTRDARDPPQLAGGEPPPQFSPGDRVRVRVAFPLGHVRTPYYVRGATGVIERCCGSFGNPEELAHGRPGEPRQPLYRVRFRQKDLWPDYRGAGDDTLEVEIYQHWLEPA
jgi:nitrile hydratase